MDLLVGVVLLVVGPHEILVVLNLVIGPGGTNGVVGLLTGILFSLRWVEWWDVLVVVWDALLTGFLFALPWVDNWDVWVVAWVNCCDAYCDAFLDAC